MKNNIQTLGIWVAISYLILSLFLFASQNAELNKFKKGYLQQKNNFLLMQSKYQECSENLDEECCKKLRVCEQALKSTTECCLELKRKNI